MPYLIDGHNLIPKAGLRLDSADDELELLDLLQAHSRRTRASMEVFFDGAPAGQATSRKFGRITAIFVSLASSADAAIKRRLIQLGGEARNWTVVSSDHEVLQAAASAHARKQTSEEFAATLSGARSARGKPGCQARPTGREGGLTDEEVQQWLEMFRKRGS